MICSSSVLHCSLISFFFFDVTPSYSLLIVARAIGIPSRIITSYSTPQNVKCGSTIDYIINEHGRPKNGDSSTWSYHVWNEMWMYRRDLNDTYGDGWQVIDSTPPINESVKYYRFGPAPIMAIQNADIYKPYECNALFSKIHSDIVTWKERHNSEELPKLLRYDRMVTGRMISTKEKGMWSREDITDCYKTHDPCETNMDLAEKTVQYANKKFSKLIPSQYNW